jgi:hypothetical protein
MNLSTEYSIPLIFYAAEGKEPKDRERRKKIELSANVDVNNLAAFSVDNFHSPIDRNLDPISDSF